MSQPDIKFTDPRVTLQQIDEDHQTRSQKRIPRRSA